MPALTIRATENFTACLLKWLSGDLAYVTVVPATRVLSLRTARRAQPGNRFHKTRTRSAAGNHCLGRKADYEAVRMTASPSVAARKRVPDRRRRMCCQPAAEKPATSGSRRCPVVSGMVKCASALGSEGGRCGLRPYPAANATRSMASELLVMGESELPS